MRLSSLCFAAVLVCSSLAWSQHSSSTTSAPAAAPAPAPSPSTSSRSFHASSPPSAPSPSSSSTSSSHSSTINSPASAPTSHTTPASDATSGRSTTSTPTENRSGISVSRSPESSPERIVPGEKISGENRIVSAPRIGEQSAEKDEKAKPAEPDLRHRVCEGEGCKANTSKPEVPESDLRRRVCLSGPCGCPQGQTASKGGCVSSGGGGTTTNYETTQTTCGPGTVWNGATCVATSSSCAAGQVWNGAACVPSRQCPVGEIWNGTRCVNSTMECASYDAQALPLVTELRRLKSDAEQACSQDHQGQACANLQAQQQASFNRYSALWNEAPSECQTRMAAPGSLI